MSIFEIVHAHKQAARMTRTWQSILMFPIPSIIYWLHNNVQVGTAKHLHPPLLHVLCHLYAMHNTSDNSRLLCTTPWSFS